MKNSEIKKWKMKSDRKPVTLFSGDEIVAGDIFESTRENIPNGFINWFEEILPEKSIKKEERTDKPVEKRRRRDLTAETVEDNVQGKEEKIAAEIEEKAAQTADEEEPQANEEEKEIALYTIKHKSGGYYDIFDPNGKQMNSRGVRGNKAKAHINELNAELLDK